MKRHTSAQARQHLSDLLDAAERGEPVFIERRGVRFTLAAAAPPTRRERAKPLLKIVDPVLETGQWTWESGRDGLVFSPRPRRR